MNDSNVMFGLKTVAKYLNISVVMVKKLFKNGMPYIRDEKGMYITTKKNIDEWFDKRIRDERKK